MNDFAIRLEKFLLEEELELKPTQNKISIPLVYRLYRKMRAEIKFDAIKVADGLIMDGHHRYVASVLAGIEIEKFPSTKNLTQTYLEWTEVTLTSIEYDLDTEIDYHNFNDAQRNGLSIEELEKRLGG